MNQTQKNVVTVLERLIAMVRDSEDDAEVLADTLENMLDLLHQNDFFGTEGQNDPRGDFRNAGFSMYDVEGA